MSESRKIVLILGNGFDLDLGLNTSYKDFWGSDYCPKDYPAPLIRHLNQRWQDDLDAVRWYDLENELYEYAVNGDKNDVVTDEEREYIKQSTDYFLNNRLNYMGGDEILYSLVAKGYIRVEEAVKVGRNAIKSAKIPYKEDFSQSVIWRDRRAFQLIKERLCLYLKSLTYNDLDSHSMALAILNSIDYGLSQGASIEIYSFNYTKTIQEYCQGFDIDFKYVHGDCSSSIIIGVGDTQIVGPDYDYLLKPFDAAYNPPPVVSSLAQAQEIIVFGHSLGKNDNQYFKSFFNKQVSDSCERKRITIFTLDDTSELQTKRIINQMTGGQISILFNLNDIQIIKTENTPANGAVFEKYLKRWWGNGLKSAH